MNLLFLFSLLPCYLSAQSSASLQYRMQDFRLGALAAERTAGSSESQFAGELRIGGRLLLKAQMQNINGINELGFIADRGNFSTQGLSAALTGTQAGAKFPFDLASIKGPGQEEWVAASETTASGMGRILLFKAKSIWQGPFGRAADLPESIVLTANSDPNFGYRMEYHQESDLLFVASPETDRGDGQVGLVYVISVAEIFQQHAASGSIAAFNPQNCLSPTPVLLGCISQLSPNQNAGATHRVGADMLASGPDITGPTGQPDGIPEVVIGAPKLAVGWGPSVGAIAFIDTTKSFSVTSHTQVPLAVAKVIHGPGMNSSSSINPNSQLLGSHFGEQVAMAPTPSTLPNLEQTLLVSAPYLDTPGSGNQSGGVFRINIKNGVVTPHPDAFTAAGDNGAYGQSLEAFTSVHEVEDSSGVMRHEVVKLALASFFQDDVTKALTLSAYEVCVDEMCTALEKPVHLTSNATTDYGEHGQSFAERSSSLGRDLSASIQTGSAMAFAFGDGPITPTSNGHQEADKAAFVFVKTPTLSDLLKNSEFTTANPGLFELAKQSSLGAQVIDPICETSEFQVSNPNLKFKLQVSDMVRGGSPTISVQGIRGTGGLFDQQWFQNNPYYHVAIIVAYGYPAEQGMQLNRPAGVISESGECLRHLNLTQGFLMVSEFPRVSARSGEPIRPGDLVELPQVMPGTSFLPNGTYSLPVQIVGLIWDIRSGALASTQVALYPIGDGKVGENTPLS